MSDPKNLTEMYIEELQDLWSANDQMKDVVKELAKAAGDEKLAVRLSKSAEGIQQHTDILRSLIQDAGGKKSKEHCKGMEGLVEEARKHGIETDAEGAVRDVAIIAQYQRMCHYGIAGFGTAKAFAQALGREEDVKKLDRALDAIYESDGYMSDLAERSRNLDALAA